MYVCNVCDPGNSTTTLISDYKGHNQIWVSWSLRQQMQGKTMPRMPLPYLGTRLHPSWIANHLPGQQPKTMQIEEDKSISATSNNKRSCKIISCYLLQPSCSLHSHLGETSGEADSKACRIIIKGSGKAWQIMEDRIKWRHKSKLKTSPAQPEKVSYPSRIVSYLDRPNRLKKFIRSKFLFASEAFKVLN